MKEDEFIKQYENAKGENAVNISMSELLYGDEEKLTPRLRKIRIQLLNSKKLRERVFGNAGLDAEVEMEKMKNKQIKNDDLGE